MSDNFFLHYILMSDIQLVSNQTYLAFCKKYKIKVTEVVNGKRRKKNILELRSEIKQYEKTNGVTDGLYY